MLRSAPFKVCGSCRACDALPPTSTHRCLWKTLSPLPHPSPSHPARAARAYLLHGAFLARPERFPRASAARCKARQPATPPPRVGHAPLHPTRCAPRREIKIARSPPRKVCVRLGGGDGGGGSERMYWGTLSGTLSRISDFCLFQKLYTKRHFPFPLFSKRLSTAPPPTLSAPARRRASGPCQWGPRLAGARLPSCGIGSGE